MEKCSNKLAFVVGRVLVVPLLLLLCVLVSNSTVNATAVAREHPQPTYDLCGHQYNGRRIYVEPGRSATIIAKNIQTSPDQNEGGVLIEGHPGFAKPLSDTQLECRLELVACPSCVIQWSIPNLNISNSNCASVDATDYIEITELSFSPKIPGQRICAHNCTGTTTSRSALLRFVYSRNYEFAFEFQLKVSRNQKLLTGSPCPNASGCDQKHLITTPFFPVPYPRDFEVEHSLECQSEPCRVHVNFIDFHLAPVSVLEIVDGPSGRVEIFTGLSSRPRILISSGNSIYLRFSANGGIGTGFKAIVNFLTTNQTTDPRWQPVTNCGGYVDRLGGAITMMQMTSNETGATRFFDCIWIIRPTNKYYYLKTHQYLQLASFSVLPHSQLTVRQGMTSNGDILGRFSELSTIETQRSNDSFEAPINDGFYVHMSANFSHNSTLALVYTVFSVSDCFLGSDFVCQNQRCIPIQVHCDGFDHCGDASDEPASCAQEWSNDPYDRRWYKYIPNYYFPGAEYDLKTASILFVSTCGAMIVLVATLFIILYRINVKARNQRELQSQLRTISELLDQSNRPVEMPEDEPPIYEAPPEYEEVIKVGMDKEIRRSRRRNPEERRRRRSRQPILEPEMTEGQATPAFANRHLILTEPFPVETAASSSAAEAEVETRPMEDFESRRRSGQPEDIQEITVEADEDAEEGDAELDEEEELSVPTANGFLIVFQNDEPTSIPVHEFIPFDQKVTMTTTTYRENPFASRISRRFSADPLLPPCSSSGNEPDLNRSFHV